MTTRQYSDSLDILAAPHSPTVMASVDTHVPACSIKDLYFKVIMLSALFLISVVRVNGYPVNIVAELQPWIPLAKEEVLSRYQNTYNVDWKHDPQDNWKPTLQLASRDSISEDSTNSADTSQNSSFNGVYTPLNTIQSNKKQHNSNTANGLSNLDNKDSTEFNATTEDVSAVDAIISSKTSRIIRKPRFQKSTLTSQNHIYKPQNKLNNETNKYTKTEILKSTIKNNSSDLVGRTYDVTENNDNNLATEQTVVKENNLYFYEKPISRIKEDKLLIHDVNNNFNLTKHFHNILGKYRINADDDLKNYELSRHTFRYPPNNLHHSEIYSLPIPLNNISPNNFQNNVSLHRLFALFLSNYGYYLPQFYKIHGGYRNLYGNLALNNIHNNKPFGPYKMFSDTY